MVKFYIVDDMHLEFSGYTMPGDPEGILLLAGDIMTPAVYEERRTDQNSLKKVSRFNQFFQVECAKYKKCFYIAGNHEYYHGSWEDTIPFMRQAVEGTNVTVLDKEWVDLGDDTVLFGATLWTDFCNNNPIVMSEARQNMNDYRLISQQVSSGMYGRSNLPLHPSTVLDEHMKTFEQLKNELQLYKDKKVVIMTHHAPSHKSSHPKYGINNPLNWAYYSNLDTFVVDNPQIKVWVHGHTHDSHDYMLDNTRVLCNPRGYSYKDDEVQENRNFNDKLSFEV